MQRIAREDSDKRIAEEVLRSPAADTLWEISGGGKPTTLANAPSLPQRIKGFTPLGYYQKFGDQVVINPTKLNYADDPDKKFDSDIARSIAMQALTHEAGHRADIRRNDAPGENAPFKVPSVDLPPPPRPGKMVQVSPKEYRAEEPYDPYAKQRAARANVDLYYQTSRREGYAQAFATAMSILRSAPRLLQEGQTRDEYANELGKIEAFTPGTGGIVEALLKEKIFQKHPLQQMYKKKTEGR